jgi:hypothetical protein
LEAVLELFNVLLAVVSVEVAALRIVGMIGLVIISLTVGRPL